MPGLGSEELLRLVFDHAGEGICVFDGSLRLQAWNPHFVELTRLDQTLVRRGAPLDGLLLAMARAGEFGAMGSAAAAAQEAQRRKSELSSRVASVTERVRPDGRTIELRHSPTPGGGFVMRYTDISQRKAAQAELHDQQRMLALLIERTEQGIWFIDNALRTTDANPAMCRMLGQERLQLLGREIFDFVDEANERIFRAQVGQRSHGQAAGYEIALRRADGSLVHCYNNATPIFDAAGSKVGAVGMFSDISPLKRAEQQIRHTGELLAQKTAVLEATFDSLAQGVLNIDVHGRTGAFNRRFLELLQIPLALMQTRPSLAELRQYQMAQGHIDPDPAGAPGPAWRRRPPLYQRSRADGTVLEVRTHHVDDGSIVRTYTDVTASVKAQRALQESESRFRAMADAAPALIWLSDADGKALWFNERWLRYTGRSLQAELALPWSHRMHAQDLDRCRRVFDDAAARQVGWELEFRVLQAHGQHAWVVEHGTTRFSLGGQFEGFTVYGWDITERKAAEAALIAAKEEAERANRAKSEFLSRMSHELRTPLNAVLGFAQLMHADETDLLSDLQRTRVQELMRGGRHLLSLINDVLDLARIEAGTLHLSLAAVDLAANVQECLPLVAASAAAREIVLRVSADVPAQVQVLADPTRLRQVLLNLLTNAIKYNHAGGQVQLTWRLDETDTVCIEVRDTGPGLSAAQQERLFQAFERLDASDSTVEGAGIGLALSRWLVELMQGWIGVHSVVGQGSVFWLRLRRAAPAHDRPAGLVAGGAASAPQPVPAPRQSTVLYVEDNEVNQLLMEGMLAHRPGIRLLMADLPETGLALAQQENPDLVLLDIQLPGMDGFEVLRRLRQQPATRDTPVVAVSANAMPADRLKAEQAGFADYVTKPLDMPLLLAVVDRMLAD